MEFLQQNISQLEVAETQLKRPNHQVLPWKTEFLAGPMNSMSLGERQVFENAFQKPLAENWNSEFFKTNADWEAKFERVSKSLDQHTQEKSWEDQFKEINADNDIDWNEKFKDIFGFNDSKSDWTSEFLESPTVLDPDPVTAPSSDYVFEVDNPFMALHDPYAEGLRLLNEEGQLSQAALAFEACVQKNPTNSDAWFHLGTTQAENEKEGPAILALERSVKENPHNSPAFMVS